jgi:RNA polymerase sigma factor for flagellar operon FliA
MIEKLEPEELKIAWSEFKTEGKMEARDRLITHYLHLVKYVVGRVGSNLPAHVKSEDMYSTGIMGLVKSIEKYDPTMKNKFETYAILLIKGAIIDEMRSLDWVPRSVHQKANLLSKTKIALEQKLGREASDGEVARELKLTMPEYEKLVNRVRPAVLIPLNADSDEDSENTHISERIPDKKMSTSYDNVDREEFRKLLEDAVLKLPEQERMVLVLYYYENMMLKEIGKVLGVSESRISQVHTKALLRLKGRLSGFSKEFANMFT